MNLAIATRIEEARRGRGEDRIAIIETSNCKLIAVTDGAGGVVGGARAAESICDALVGDAGDWPTWLSQQDAFLSERATGLAAAVVLSISGEGAIHGASVGDCEAWVFGQGKAVNLTAGQTRKPLLGDGGAVPVSFSSRMSSGTLVVATDGLWKYIKHAHIAAIAMMRPIEAAVATLVEGVRLRSGTLQDDVAIVMCEVTGV
jgi:PPM family protein phosphatase